MDIQKLKDKMSAMQSMFSEIQGMIDGEKPKKLSKEEYLSKSDEEREKYDRDSMEEEPEKKEEEGQNER